MGWYIVKIWSVFYNWVNLTTLLFWTLSSHTQQKKWRSSLTETKVSFSSGSSATGKSDHTETHSRDMIPAGCRSVLSWIAGISPLCFDRDFFLCSVTHIFFPFYSISLCFLNPCKWQEHAISSNTLHRKHLLPLFWTWHTLALLVASDICWETSWNCSPFPLVLIIFTAQFSHSKAGKSSFI